MGHKWNSKETIRAGADYIIVGRGIYLADDPALAAEKYMSDFNTDD